MEVIAANFSTDETAAAAARELTSELSLDEDMVEIEHLAPAARRHAGEPLVVAWVDEDSREEARSVIERHHGRHVPFDWVEALQEEVVADTVPSIVPEGSEVPASEVAPGV
jgi:hypothetical protein